MNETNTNTNTTTTTAATQVTSAFCTLAAKVKKSNGKLPRIEQYRVDIDKGTGSAADWHATGYLLMVKVRGVDGFYAAGSVGAYYGMNIKSRYKTAAMAADAGHEMQKTWGRPSKAALKKGQATLEEQVKTMTPEQKAELMKMLMAA